MEDAQEFMFLGEPDWELLQGGNRVRCVQTGHEMPLAAQRAYAASKKCRSALFEAALVQRKPPLNFFEQSPVVRDKIVCKLTGVILNKKEDAVWKHMLGRKFEQKLAEKEAEKERARGDVEMAENSSVPLSSKKSANVENFKRGEDKSMMKKIQPTTFVQEEGGEEVGDEDEELEELEDEDADLEDAEFWVPPVGDRWDFDTGDGRWCVPSHDYLSIRRKPLKKVNGSGGVVTPEDYDIEMMDGEQQQVSASDGNSSDDQTKICIKRMPLPGSQKKRKAKRLKAESNEQQ